MLEVFYLARGKSGRIVLEIEPEIKRNLYLALEFKQITLKEWFLEMADLYISENLSLDKFQSGQKDEFYSK